MSVHPNHLPAPRSVSLPSTAGPPIATSEISALNKDLFDRTLVLLLEREETLLGDIIGQCQSLVQMAEMQVQEVAEFLDDQM